MLEWDLAVGIMSVCLSVTYWYCIKTIEHRIMQVFTDG